MNICMQEALLMQSGYLISHSLLNSRNPVLLSKWQSRLSLSLPLVPCSIPSQARYFPLAATARPLPLHLFPSVPLFCQSLLAVLAAVKSALSKPGTVHHLWHDRVNGCARHMAAWLQSRDIRNLGGRKCSESSDKEGIISAHAFPPFEML